MKKAFNFKFVILCIVDGIAIRKQKRGNALKKAHMPFFNYLWKNYSHLTLNSSGTSVGLPKKQVGNSEVGHMNIGAGRIVKQTLQRINEDIQRQELKKNKNLLDLLNTKSENKIHILSLLSPGGVHSHIDHLWYILRFFNENKVKNKIYIHAFTDGRDYKTNGSEKILEKLNKYLTDNKLGIIASVSGRYYSMDRDNNYDRTIKAYKSIVNISNNVFDNVGKYISSQYKEGITDEFIVPASYKNRQELRENDALLFLNFRADRAKQLLKLFCDSKVQNKYNLKSLQLKLITITDYKVCENIKILFPDTSLPNTLGEYVSKAGLSQLRIAETEKFAHVTYFFNGGYEKEFLNEHRILVPSPKVSTYDKKPEMSAYKIKEELLTFLENKKVDLTVLNFANADMVGHTANMKAIIKSLETIDACLEDIYEFCKRENGLLIITSDHGNADEVYDRNKIPLTTHTRRNVPLIVCNKSILLKKSGKLADISPTIIEILGLDLPIEMKGRSLIRF